MSISKMLVDGFGERTFRPFSEELPPFNQGYMALYAKKDYTHNPYIDPDSDQFWEWLRGFSVGFDEWRFLNRF